MGNEASLEGEGEGLPEGLAAATGGGAGGAGSSLHPALPAGMEADLSQLSEDERRQIAAVMSRAQGLPKGSVAPAAAEPPSMHRKQELDSSHFPKEPGKPPDSGRAVQPGLSKSRTTDTFRSEQKLPGRSPSTISLKESKSRTDFKDEHKSSMMPGFLSDVNPLSAVSSVVNKFNPFDLISDSEASQEETAKKQKAAPKEQGKPEAIPKAPLQQSPKPVPKQQGSVKAPLQQDVSSKTVPSQQLEKMKSHPSGKPTQGLTQAPQTDQVKMPLQRDATKPQTKQSDSVRGESDKIPAQSASKPPIQQASSGKPLAVQPASEKVAKPQPGPPKSQAQQPGPVKPQVQPSGTVKPSLQPLTTKPAAQPPATMKPATQQPGPKSPAQSHLPAKPQVQQAASEKPLSQQPGTKPGVQSPIPAKSPVQQPGPAKLPAQQVGTPKSSAHQPTAPSLSQPFGPAKTPAQQPGPGKTPSQQPGPAKITPQQPGPPKPVAQQPGPAKPAAPSPGPAKPATQQPGPAKPATQQPGPAKPATQQPGPAKPLVQQSGPAKPEVQQPGPAKPSSQQPGTVKPLAQQPSPAKPSAQQPGAAKPSPQQPGSTKPLAQQPTKPGSQTGVGKPAQPSVSLSSGQTSVQGLPKTICPLCNTTELLLNVPEKANFNTCTECQTTVCSLCGFNPNPHLTEIKEWLCLNCQMQRALGGELTPVPSSPQPKSKAASAIPASVASKPSPPISPKKDIVPKPSPQISPKKDVVPKQDTSMAPDSKKTPPLVKQSTLHGSPPVTVKQPPVADATSKSTPSKEPPASSEQATVPPVDDKPKLPKMAKPVTDAVSSSSATTKPDTPSSKTQPQDQEKKTLLLKTDSAKPSQSFPPTGEKVTSLDSTVIPRPASDSKIVSQPGSSSENKGQKQADSIQKREESKKAQTKTSPKPEGKPVPKGSSATPGPQPTPGQTAPVSQPPPKEQSRRFSLNLGSITDAPKSQPTTPSESVTGKLFGFGASIFSQASSLISTAGQPSSHAQGGPGTLTKQAPSPSQPPASQVTPKSTGQAPPTPANVVPVKKETKAPGVEKLESKAEKVPPVKRTETERKPPLTKDTKPSTTDPQKAAAPPKPEKIPKPESVCPLCKTELNMGSKDPPNFNTCTECKKQVCNLCGFNPTPHLTEETRVG